jgi:DNA-binding NarL/FixJ family response regulator
MIKILLAEDHHVVRDGLRFILDQEPDMQVIFEASNGLDVLDYLKEEQEPDLILTDMNMPGFDGMAMINALPKDYPVLILSMLDHEQYVIEAINAGARGYLLKSVNKNEMLFAIRYVAGGGIYICQEISLKLINHLTLINKLPAPIKLDVELSDREAELLNLIADGFTNKEIAAKLFSSRRTVEGHRQSLMDKTGSKNTATLIKFAVQNGLVN